MNTSHQILLALLQFHSLESEHGIGLQVYHFTVPYRVIFGDTGLF
jgi:hypothetical protein